MVNRQYKYRGVFDAASLLLSPVVSSGVSPHFQWAWKWMQEIKQQLAFAMLGLSMCVSCVTTLMFCIILVEVVLQMV